ncbi:MAG: type I methionyl aminopeptidase [Candidatus Paceibacterota bacterium]|jgi:methionyl aminopeptidase
MIKIKNKNEIKIMREAGKNLAYVLESVSKKVRPGISTKELDNIAKNLIISLGDEPAFLNYKPKGGRLVYPASLCVSINNEVVHGIPSPNRILKEGDIVSLDLGLKHNGFFSDMAVTLPVGKINKKYEKLLRVTEESLVVGINSIKKGSHVGDIGYSIEKFVKPFKFGIVRVLSGHGIGKELHEDPFVPNFGKKGSGEILLPGMVIAIEPMLNEGSHKVFVDKDGWTFKTEDGGRSAHFEHTILIKEDSAEILTKI